MAIAPSLLALTAVLSCDVTRILVANGFGLGYDTDAAAGLSSGAGRFTGANAPATSSTATPGSPYPSLAIVGCTGSGVSPIVVTTAYPHGVSGRGIGGSALIVSGVTGNTAANNVSTDPNDRTVGLPQGVLAKPLTPTTLALYGQDQTASSATVGQLIPLVGNGAWTGGGTLTPALTDGQILLGRENVKEHSSPPRIVMVPKATQVGPDDMSVPSGKRTAERQFQIAQRSIGSDALTFEVHCWGQYLPVPDPQVDFDVTNAIAQAVKVSSYLLFGAASKRGAGRWDDERERATQLVKTGHLFTFELSVDVPVLDYPLTFAPTNVVMETTVQSPTPQTAQVIDVTL